MLAGDDLSWPGVGKAVKELLPEYKNVNEFFEKKRLSKNVWIHIKC